MNAHDFKAASSFNITLSGFAKSNGAFLRQSQTVKISSDETQSLVFQVRKKKS